MNTSSSTVDATQHGGTHYKNDYQHWNMLPDFMFGPEYYIGCATKYVTRHAKKNGAEDIDKSMHFTRKLIELVRDGRMYPRQWNTAFRQAGLGLLANYGVKNELKGDGPEMRAIMYLMLGTHITHYEKALACLEELADWYQELPPKAKTVAQPKGLPPAAYTAIDPQFGAEGYWGDALILWKCRKCGVYFKCKDGTPPRQAHEMNGACPPKDEPAAATPAYVNQDR